MSWIGIPYSGDNFCREFARQYLDAKGIPMPCVESPEQAIGWERVDIPMENDVVVFNRFGKPSHVGVCIGNGDFLHVEEGGKSYVERLSSRMWERRIEGFYRYVGDRS